MSYRLEIGLALLLAAGIGVAVWAANRTAKPPPVDYRASTFLTGPEGSKALYDVLVRLGQPTERRRTPLFRLNQDTLGHAAPAVLVLADPFIRLQEAELIEVVDFVRAGGAVVAAGRGAGMLHCVGWRLDPTGILDDSVAVRPPAGAPPGLRLPRVGRALAPEGRDRRRGLAALVKGRATDDPCDFLTARNADTLLAAVDGRPVTLRLRYDGGGSVTLMADVGWFHNRVWRDTDVPIVLLPWLTPPQAPGQARGRVTWSEYHQGFGRVGTPVGPAAWAWLRRTPTGWAVLQLVAVALVWLGVSAVRFGPARSVIERRRRSPLEHLEALAAGLESAGGGGEGGDTTVQRIVSGLRRRLSRSGAAANVSGGRLELWLDTLDLVVRGPRGRDAVRRLQMLVSGAGARLPAADRAVATAQAVEDVWEELRPRTTRDAF